VSAARGEEGSGISVTGATVTYRNGHTALLDASFAIPTGTITALVGVNGSGKSTLFKAIMGFVPVSGGSISVLSLPVRTALKRRLVAYVPQSEDVDWSFPVLVEDVVLMGRYGHMNWLRTTRGGPRGCGRRPGAGRHERLPQAADRRAVGGQKKRVFLARALAQDGRVILLDEPFTGVDVNTEEAITDLLRTLRDEGRVMLVSTHNLGSVPEFCDRTVLLDRTVVASGPTEEVFTHTNLERTFGGVLRHFVLKAAPVEPGGRRAIGVLTDDERPFIVYERQPDPGDPTRTEP
jgi:manganese/iron transport system ATP-binding protein